MARSVSSAAACLPSSPNWYCSKVSDCNASGLLAYGSRNVLVLLRLRDAFRVDHVASLSAHKERIAGLCFSPLDASLLVSVGDDLSVNLTNVDSFATVVLHDGHKGKPTCVTWARARDVVEFVVSGDENGAVVACNVASKKTKCWTAEARTAVTGIAGCPHAPHLVAVGYKTGLISLMDLHQDGAAVCRLRNHDGEIQSLCWAPFDGARRWAEEFGADGDYSADSEKLLASGSGDGTIKVWSTQRGIPLASFSPPTNLGVPRWKQGNEKKSGTWMAVTWPASKPDVLIGGSHSGVLVSWDLLARGQKCLSVLGPKDNKNHARAIFNVACFGNVACTISMDRQIIFWNIDSSCDETSRLSILPSLGGFVYSLSFSPVNSGLVALACGDNTIRTWNVTSATNAYDVASFWQGIKSKVTAICWHPRKEGILAYGTEEGRVGIYNVLSNKLPTILKCFHVKTVYAVSWGPACPTKDRADQPGFLLYSCGNGTINVHDPSANEKAALNLNKLIPNCSSKAAKACRTEIAWNSDFSALSIGNSDGTVEVYSTVDLRCLLLVSSQCKLVHCVRWHPEYTLSSSAPSQFRFWMAVATQDSTVHVHDLGAYFDGSGVGTEPINVTACNVRLVGHGSSVASLSWNPHLDAQLVTASFDNTVRVWDVVAGRATACFSNHLGRVLCAEWNPLDPNVVYSGGEDFTVQSWKISEQDLNPSARVLREVERLQKKLAQRKNSKKVAASKLDASNDKPSERAETSGTPSVLDESIQKLLEQRKLELMFQSEKCFEESERKSQPDSALLDIGESPNRGEIKPVDGEENCGDVPRPGIAERDADSGVGQKPKAGKTGVPSSGKKKKKRTEKSLFPLTSCLENRGKASALEDCLALTDELTAGSARAGEESRLNLRLYTDRVGAYKLVKAESDNHLASGNLDYALHLEIWKGNVSGALKMAAKNEQLSDWLVSMAVAVSPSFWSEMSLLYVKQLINSGYPHKAVLHLLAQNKVHEAVNVLKTHASYKEALVLAKVRLPPNDPLIVQLIDEWAMHFAKEGNCEGAAKCYLAAGQHDKAASILGQKNDAPSVRAGAYIASKFDDGARASLYANKCIFDCMLNKDFDTAEALLHDHPQMKPYSHVIRVYRHLQEFFAGAENSRDFSFATLRQMFEEAMHPKSSSSKDEEITPLPSGEFVLGGNSQLGEEQPDDGFELEACETCLGLFPAMPVPQQESHIVPWISVMLTLGCVDLLTNKTIEFLRRALTIFAVLHKSGNVPWLVRFRSLLRPADDLDVDVTLTENEQTLSDGGADAAEETLISLRAYMSLSSIHRLVDSEQKFVGEATGQAECVFRKFSAAVVDSCKSVLNEERAELSRLKTRLAYTKVALASVSASRKRAAVAATFDEPPTEIDIGEESKLEEIHADVLIASPGITVERLRAECDRLEAQIARFADRFQVEAFPDPLNSAVLLAEFCCLHHRRCGCEESALLSKTVLDFGRKYSTLLRQTEKLDQFRCDFDPRTSE